MGWGMLPLLASPQCFPSSAPPPQGKTYQEQSPGIQEYGESTEVRREGKKDVRENPTAQTSP